METLQSTIFIEFDVNTKKITFLRGDNVIDYDSNVTSVYVRVKYKNLSGNTVYLTPSELEDYEFSLYTMKPATNNVNVITGKVTDELKQNVYGGVVKFEIPRACTNRLGIVKCEIHINQANKMIASSIFVLDVKQSLVTAFNDELLGDEDFPVLRQLILEIQKVNNINDNYRSKITTYSSDKIETIKEDLNSQINDKVNRGEGGVITNAMLSQEVKESMTGGSVAVVGVNSILSENIVNKQVTPYKTDFVGYDDIMSQDGIVVGSINSVGTINSDSITANTSDFIPVEEGMPIEIPGKISYLAYYNVNKHSLVSALGRLSNLNNYKGVIPSNIDPVKYIRITWSTDESYEYYREPSTINIFKADKMNLLTPFKDGSIDFSVIKGSEDLIKDDNIYFEYGWNTLFIYMRTIADNTYLCYRFKHMSKEYVANDASSNYDIWKLRGVGVYEKDGDTFKDILTDGLIHESSEWECAIKETGMPDFVGGSIHGDEILESIVFMLDGIVYTDPIQFVGKTCKELRIIRKSKLYRCNTNKGVHIANHYVDYLFKNNEVTIDNRVDWKVDTNCGISYLCMLGAKRLNGTTQITNRGIKQGDGNILDVSTEGHSNIETTNRCTKAYLWNDGTNGGVNVIMSIEILDNNFFPNFNFKFDNRAEYNKFYFDQCGLNFEVKTGDVWFNKAKYKIDYLGKY